jgi:hypothetical protein
LVTIMINKRVPLQGHWLFLWYDAFSTLFVKQQFLIFNRGICAPISKNTEKFKMHLCVMTLLNFWNFIFSKKFWKQSDPSETLI